MSVILEHLRLPLAHFTLEVDAVLEGRVTAVFGPSGAGKTSLLELVAGLRRPAAGAVRVAGRTLTDAGAGVFVPVEQRSIGYVPQDGALFPHLSVRRNLLYGFAAGRSRAEGLSFDHVTEVLEIRPLVERSTPTLSAGEKQRVALGRALLASPGLLLLDEPLSGLDSPLKQRLMPYLQRVRDEFGVPMICITHSPGEVVALCDDVLVLNSGRVVDRGPPRDLFATSPVPRYRLRESSRPDAPA